MNDEIQLFGKEKKRKVSRRRKPLSFYLAKGGKRWLLIGRNSMVVESSKLRQIIGVGQKYPSVLYLEKSEN
jgi:hypothetical protein